MAYKWKPSAEQRRQFALKMQNPEERLAYEQRKAAREAKRREGSKFDYGSAGGNYTPTKAQHDFCFENMHLFITSDEENAANMVMSGYVCREKVHHDYIHVVNEKIRTNLRSL